MQFPRLSPTQFTLKKSRNCWRSCRLILSTSVFMPCAEDWGLSYLSRIRSRWVWAQTLCRHIPLWTGSAILLGTVWLKLIRIALLAMGLPFALGLLAQASLASELRIATWNLEHLKDSDGEGCVGRTIADYAAITDRLADLDADIVALQEVENAAAAHRVFPALEWRVEMSARPPTGQSARCRQRPSYRLGHLATGFAIRKGIVYRRNADYKALGSGNPFQRWGADITVRQGGHQLRLLSVHLISGCWGARQDANAKRNRICDTLHDQIRHLKSWADARRFQGSPFVILGDFNRRLALEGDWAWRLLSPSRAPLRLLPAGLRSHCDPRYPAFIDHLVLGAGAEAMLVSGSFQELPRHEQHPDHCAVSAVFRFSG